MNHKNTIFFFQTCISEEDRTIQNQCALFMSNLFQSRATCLLNDWINDQVKNKVRNARISVHIAILFALDILCHAWKIQNNALLLFPCFDFVKYLMPMPKVPLYWGSIQRDWRILFCIFRLRLESFIVQNGISPKSL